MVTSSAPEGSDTTLRGTPVVPGLAAHEKSLAVRLTLASGEATLTDEQIDAAVKAVVDSIAGRLGGRLRG